MVLYALGSNGSGQLGIGRTEDVAVPTRHELGFDGATLQPLRIVGGGNHTLILTVSGELFGSGSLASHSHPTLLRQKTPSLHTLLLGRHVKYCSATWEGSTIAYAGNGLCTHGKGERGELGRDAWQTSSALTIPRILPVSELSITSQIIDIASGVQHTVVVFADGQVLGWGNGRKGQLGEPTGIVSQPRKIHGIEFKVKRAVCGREFTYLLGDGVEGHHAVLGSDKWGVRSQAPAKVAGWKDASATWGSILVLLQSGSIISWGRDDHGQLAPSTLPTVSKIACGSEHCVALTPEGQVLSWGWGEHGNCGPRIDGDGDTKPGWNQLELPFKDRKIVGVGAGCATSWMWTLPES